MRLLGGLSTYFLTSLISHSVALGSTGQSQFVINPFGSGRSQDIVTWDQHSILVHGERVVFYSGEFHPFRLPVPGLWLDVFQKIRAMGYTGVSFYVDWALLEGKRGRFSAEGIFALEPFFDAATQAGIYLLARPGPYVNGEVAGGGFPGWMQRVPGVLRTMNPAYLNATQLYVESVGKIIAKAQITEGGPVILFQPENEYYKSNCLPHDRPCPDSEYMAYVQGQWRNTGIVVPFIVNDDNTGNFAPGQPAAVDLYGIDRYPLGFDCGSPDEWHAGGLETTLTKTHLDYSPSTPFAFIEFQGGSFDPWGGWGFSKCSKRLNSEFERVFYANNFASGITIFSIYMTYGGSNWGNLGHPGGYSSYDYGAVIREDRRVDREKYSQAKLLANFVASSPAYVTATPGNLTRGIYTSDSALSVTPLFGNGSNTNFYVLRHADYRNRSTTTYRLLVSTSKGRISIPQRGGELSLHGRDSTIHVTDYDIDGITILYSTAEIFTWDSYQGRRVLVVYGGPDEHHELGLLCDNLATIIEGHGVRFSYQDNTIVIDWHSSSERRVVSFGKDLLIYILDRNSAYDYWVLKVPNERGLYAPNHLGSTVIVKGGYLMRNVSISGDSIKLFGDFDATAEVQVVGGAPSNLKHLEINGKSMKFNQDQYGIVTTTITFNPDISVPSLSSLDWKYIDSLPEIKPGYDDSHWPVANLTYTHNSNVDLSTPVSLIGSDYGFNTGVLLFRGHFTANGKESYLFLETEGGAAFGSSVWINSTYVGSFVGNDAAEISKKRYALPGLFSGAHYVITVLVDQMGMEQGYVVGENKMKNPRGILHYHLSGHSASDVSWKLTGNLHGEDYEDIVRGPLNEGGLWAERRGFHLPGAPTGEWISSGGPTKGIDFPGVGFFAAELPLDIPRGWDVPLSFTFTNFSIPDIPGNWVPAYRVQLYVNGYQFGKYVHNIGPQKSFPVPQGILNYQGTNYIAIALWSLESGGSRVEGLELTINGTILSGYGDVPMAPMSSWSQRAGAY